MSRHRNVRSMKYEDEFYDEDDVYGHSIEDNYCISPGTAAQFTYNREHNVALSNFMDEQGGIPEEVEGEDTDEGTPRELHRSSSDCARPKLTDVDEAKLNSVLEEVRNVIGESVPEGVMVDTIMRHNFSVEGSLNELLNQQDKPKPQREPRRDRRNRLQELDDEIDYVNSASPIQGNVFSCISLAPRGSLKFGASVSPHSPSFLVKSNNVSSDQGDVITVSKQCTLLSTSSDKFNKISNVLNGKGKTDQQLLSSNLSGHLPCSTQSNTNYYDQTSQLESKLEGHKTLAKSESKPDINMSLSVLSKTRDLRNKGIGAKPQTNVGVSLSALAGLHLGKDALAGVYGDSQGSTPSASNLGSCLVTLSALSKSPAGSGPSHAGSAPSHVGSAPSPVGSAPSPVGSAPSHAGSAPSHACSAPSPAGSAPSPADSAPSHAGSAPSHAGSAPSPAGSAPSPAGSAPSHAGSAPSHAGSAPSGMASSLSQLAEAHAARSKCPAPGLSSVGMSLSQLAEAQGIAKSSLGLNPAKDYKDNSIEENSVNFGFGKQKSASLLSSEMFKNTTDKAQIMLSLSSLIEKQGTSKYDERTVVTQQSACISSKTDTDRQGYNIDQQNVSVCNRSKIGKQSAEHSKLSTLSLVDLAKGKSPRNQKEIKSASKAITCTIKAKKLKKEENGIDEMRMAIEAKATKQYNKDVSDLGGLLDVKIKLTDDVHVETVKHLMKGPSNVGSTLCLEISVKAKRRKPMKYKRKKFSYSWQMKDMKERRHVELKQIKAFDFSTLSPDDVVKAKQKRAFNRSGT